MKRGGSSLPLVTDRNEPMPSSSISLRSSTLTLTSGNSSPSCLRALAEVGRRADVARQVAEIAREVHAVGDRQALRRGLLAGGEVRALRHRQRELAQRPPHLGRLALHLLEAVDRLHRDDHRVLDAPHDLAPLDLLLGEVEDRLVGAGFVQQLDRGADRASGTRGRGSRAPCRGRPAARGRRACRARCAAAASRRACPPCRRGG